MMSPGDHVNLAGYTYTFQGTRKARGPNYIADIGTIAVSKDGTPFSVMYPENRIYLVENRPMTEAAIKTTFWGDLYVALGNKDPKTGSYVVRIFYNPMVLWLWVGALMLTFGAVVSLMDRKHRVGVPAKARTRSLAHPAPAE